MMVTSCASEGSFSNIKLKKKRLRTCMEEDLLIDLVIFSSEIDTDVYCAC